MKRYFKNQKIVVFDENGTKVKEGDIVHGPVHKENVIITTPEKVKLKLIKHSFQKQNITILSSVNFIKKKFPLIPFIKETLLLFIIIPFGAGLIVELVHSNYGDWGSVFFYGIAVMLAIMFS